MSTTRNVFKAIVFALAGAILVFLLLGQMLADEWHVETRRTIAATPADIAAVVHDFGTWHEWSSADVNLGPQTTRRVDGEPGTVGHRIVWQGPKGTSTLLLSRVDQNGVEYTFRNELDGQPSGPSLRGGGTIQWAADGNGCVITWRDAGEWDSLAGRWIGWFGALQEKLRQWQGSSLEGLAMVIAERRESIGK
jgi:hypothetical protein